MPRSDTRRPPVPLFETEVLTNSVLELAPKPESVIPASPLSAIVRLVKLRAAFVALPAGSSISRPSSPTPVMSILFATICVSGTRF